MSFRPSTPPPKASEIVDVTPPARWRGRRIVVELVVLTLLLLPWLDRLFDDPPVLLLFLGRFHPLVLHLPIGALVVALLMELVAVLPRFRVLREAAGFVLFVGACSAVVAVVSGLFLSYDGYEGDLVSRHMYLGLGTAIAAVLASLCKTVHQLCGSFRTGFVYAVVLLATQGLLVLAGHAGASLTHGAGYLTHYLPGILDSGEETELPPTIYAGLIEPIMQSRCTSCHGEEKQKGGLRTDSFEALIAGGETPPTIVPGDPDESELVYRITLPPDDVDIMPPEGKKPLSEDDIALIRWWIASGASAEARPEDVDVPDEIRRILDTRVSPEEQQRRREEAAAKLARLTVEVARIRSDLDANILPLAQGAPDLQFSCAGSPRDIDDRKLVMLAPIADSMVWLDLAGSGVGDDGLAQVAGMKRLRRLALQNTAVTGAGLHHLAGLNDLEYLNLYGTAVDDEGLQQLAGLTRLETLYLWQTAVSDAGVNALQQALPDVEIIRGAGEEP